MTEQLSAYPSTSPDVPATRRRLLLTLPATGFVALAGIFAVGLNYDPSKLPSALIGKKVPEFELPPVKGRTLGLSSKNLLGEVSLVNVFASWCVACRAEHPVFMELTRKKLVPLHGLNYKDAPDDAAQWLNTIGDPYARTGADLNGRVAIDWGVYGVPETFVVDGKGIIRFKWIGPLTPEALRDTLEPEIAKARQAQ